MESLPDGRYRFSLAEECTLDSAERFRQALSEEQGLGIEALDEVPEVLTREMTWAEYEAQPRTNNTVSPASFKSEVILQPRERSLTLAQRGDVAPPDVGFLVVSLQGDKKRLERRSEAEQAIREARCPMPQLGLLVILVLLPLQMLSGGSTPRESMPQAVQDIMLTMPTTHFVSLAQAILYRGADFAIVWPQFLTLLAIGGVFFTIALLRFRKTIGEMA